MTLQSRLDRYTSRGFSQEDAEILVLIEEAASGLFAAFADRFILVGGATLVLFYESRRVSRDLDLLPTADELPASDELQAVVDRNIQPLADVLGFGKLAYNQNGNGTAFLKLWIKSGDRVLFSIDVTRIGGAVLKSEIVQEAIAGNTGTTIFTPSTNFLLLQKCETFLERRHIKARDAFDIDVLLLKGAKLGEVLLAHLDDFIQMRELDAHLIQSRIASVNAKLCTAELRPVLPDELFGRLAKNDFRQLRDSLASAFKNWI
jgi:Nucleotidyl transferase AbiEii toxin, Type IV TA system